MPSRLATGLIFAALGAVATVIMFAVRGEGTMPTNVVVLIPIFALAAFLCGWLIAHKFVTRFRFFAILLGAVTMMAAQIPFALLAVLWFGLTEGNADGSFMSSIGTLIVGGWAIGAQYQVVAGALAGWLAHHLFGTHDEYPDEDDTE